MGIVQSKEFRSHLSSAVNTVTGLEEANLCDEYGFVRRRFRREVSVTLLPEERQLVLARSVCMAGPLSGAISEFRPLPEPMITIMS